MTMFKYLKRLLIIMGIILGTKVEVDYDDSLKLKGHVKNIHVFSEDAAELKTNLAQRGTNDTTKYFLIPKELREGLNFDKSVKCQKIETDSRKIFIFVMDKVGE